MPTAKNEFQILNVHPKKHVLKRKNFLGMVILATFTLLTQ